MKLKQIFAIALIAFVFTSLAYMAAKETKVKPATNTTEDNSIPVEKKKDDTPAAQVIVYYFHGDVRCETCRKLEAYAKETLDTFFAGELTSGKIAWQVVNVEQPQNEHFIQDYKLITKSIVLSEVTDGKELEWKNMDRIWQEVGNKQDYLDYIRDGIAKFMEDKKL